MSKNKIIFSEAFPPNKRGYREKKYSISSSHSLLDGKSITSDNITYKPLSSENFEEVKFLHKEWFPIDYHDNYYKNVLDKNNAYYYFTIGAFSKIYDNETNKESEIIVGLALCEWISLSSEVINHIGQEAYQEIIENVNYKEEVKSYLSCEYFKIAYIMTIGVMDEYRKMKIGTNLINKVNEIAINDNLCVGIYLDVVHYNYGAIKFYQKNEFKKVAVIKRYYNINKNKYDAYVFLKIFSRKDKDDNINKKISCFQRIIYLFAIDPISFVVKIFLIIFFLQCFKKKIKIK